MSFSPYYSPICKRCMRKLLFYAYLRESLKNIIFLLFSRHINHKWIHWISILSNNFKLISMLFTTELLRNCRWSPFLWRSLGSVLSIRKWVCHVNSAFQVNLSSVKYNVMLILFQISQHCSKGIWQFFSQSHAPF